MSMKYAYAHEKFSCAVDELIAGESEIEVRLAKAGEHICLLTVGDIPDSCKEEFKVVREEFTKDHKYSASRGLIWANVATGRKTKKRIKKLQVLAGNIFNIYETLRK